MGNFKSRIQVGGGGGHHQSNKDNDKGDDQQTNHKVFFILHINSHIEKQYLILYIYYWYGIGR